MEMSTSKPDQWTIKEIGQAYDDQGIGANVISVPRFQRSLVWSEDQRRMLIDSLYRGFPIGAILGYQTGEKRGKRNVIQIVDGLQRTSSIAEYLLKPLFYAPVDRVFSAEVFTKVAKAIGLGSSSDSISAVEAAFEKWMREVQTAKLGKKFSSESLTNSVSDTLGIAKELLEPLIDDLNEELGNVMERVKDVESLAIPVVLYSGDVGNIPTIFERVNNQGTQLSKYEILASSWVSSQTRITNPDVRDKILKKYQVLKDRGYEIDGLPEGASIQIDDYNLYEYLFGLGKVLAEKYPRLFGSSGAADESIPTGFVLVTTAMGLRLSKMGDLVTVLRKRQLDPNSPIDMTAIEKAIFVAVEAIGKSLDPFLSLHLHKKDDSTVIAHSQNQILSLISAYLVNRFDTFTWKERPGNAYADIGKNAASHYILDIVAKRWRGSGDSRLHEVTWQEDASIPSNYYVQKVSKVAFVDAMRQWHEELLTKKQKERPNVPGAAQVVLLFLYAKLVPVFDNKATEYELEHIYPVSTIAERIAELGDDGWPISALGNLMLLPKDLNRIKGSFTLGDYIPTLSGDEALSAAEIESVNKFLVVPEYAAITKASLTDRDYYLEFCRTRLLAIANRIAENLNLV